MKRPTVKDIKKEITVHTSRSSGPGGQHVNKVETKVVLRWNVKDSMCLSATQKELIQVAFPNKLTKDGEVIVSADSKRSQLKNKEIAFKKLDKLLKKAFLRKKKRLSTNPTRASKKKRLQEKRKLSEKKELRKRIL